MVTKKLSEYKKALNFFQVRAFLQKLNYILKTGTAIKIEDDTPSLEEIEEKENDDFGNSEVEETEKDNKKNKKVK